MVGFIWHLQNSNLWLTLNLVVQFQGPNFGSLMSLICGSHACLYKLSNSYSILNGFFRSLQ